MGGRNIGGRVEVGQRVLMNVLRRWYHEGMRVCGDDEFYLIQMLLRLSHIWKVIFQAWDMRLDPHLVALRLDPDSR